MRMYDYREMYQGFETSVFPKKENNDSKFFFLYHTVISYFFEFGAL